ncbi:regulator of (H+)-ATPase in vacuolar membrane [Coemansia umbellata]|uniref:MICOS complex subunit MIC60 n=1 Tax=Coemansia umbellata TaxID=1424467 RepID=A0ABQ8PPX2_9FUNG|nr:regulator of (H+)-ATPase in vacuolar membrane [Coemansia umbellata]
MALDGTQIRIIAWAPAKSEFIAATDKQVYRLVYDSNKEQWTPSDSSLPNIKPYDRIFTYPTEISDFDESTQDQQSYFISTVSKESRTIQTWRVAASNKMIEYIGSLNLKNDARFDLASRVMPAPYPFFSLDNIMATFDTSTGKLRIWGIRAKPRFVWFCSKEHLLPCMNVKMIRYNSIDKAAIVSMEEDGSQIITVWVFSSASRESHYLPAGTIYPRKKTDCVREIRWHFTDYAQTYLGIQWDDRVDVYCQERNLDNAWRCIFTISSTDFGLKKEIGSFSFTSLGEPTFSVENQLFICSQSVPSSGKLISDITFEHHGELPLIHPFVLTELLSWGKMDVVQRLLSLMYDYMRRLELDRNCNASLPMISIHDLISADGTDGRNLSRSAANTKTNNLSKYSGLFASEEPSSIVRLDTSEPDFERFDSEKADYLLEKLTEIKIKGISAIEQSRLMSIVGTISAGLAKDHPLDEMGMRYLLKLHLLELENKRTRSSSELSYRELNWAMYSNSQAILLQICLQQHATTGLTWELARRMGLFMWLSDTSVLHAEVEKMARNIFVADGRDPTKCAIFYLALKKQRLLHGLWRTANSHPDQSKMLAFLFHDFSEARWKTAAAKNAYVLLSKQRYFDAATFFMLSDKLADAATICITQLKDVQLAITICRCYEGENGPVLRDLIWKHVLPDAFKRQDRWLASLAFGIIQKYDLVLRSLTDDLSKLSSQIGVAAEVSSYSAMNVADTELLILYRNMLSHSPHYRAPLVVQAQLIASTITIFECLGVPIMALVVLEWWRKELYDITKKSVLSAKPPSSTPATELIDKSISTGVPDMSAFGGFSKYAPASSGSNSNSKSLMSSSTADPLASGMLSMDSFGPMFSGISVSASRPSKRPSGQGNLANGTQASLNSTSNAQHTMHRSSDSNGADSDSDNVTDDATLAMDIEDTPVQYACRVMLALQIADYVRRICDGTNESVALDNINLEAEKQTIAETLPAKSLARYSSAFPLRTSTHFTVRRFASSNGSSSTTATAASSTTTASTTIEKNGVRDPNTVFTAEPKPSRKQKKKSHKIRNIAILTLLGGSGFIAAAAYAREDAEFGQHFEYYVPGAKSFMRLIKHHDDSLLMAISDVGFKTYDELAYTGRFIYNQFSGVLNMLKHNSWQAPDSGNGKDSDTAGKHESASPEKSESTSAKPKTTPSGSPVAVIPTSKIQLAVEIPPLASENEAVASLSKALASVVTAFNKKGLSAEEFQQLNALNSALIALDNHLGTIKNEEKQAVESALAEERGKFEKVLTDFQEMARAALLSREAQLLQTRDEQLKAAAAAADERIALELAEQRDLLERRFNRFVRARVDEERGGRLAHIERVESQLRQLTQTAQESGNLIRQSRAIAKVGVALAALKKAAVESSMQKPFASELVALSSAATTDFPATRAAIALIPRDIAEQGVLSQTELEDRFEAVRKEIRSVSLVPENGNFGSQVLSATLSKLMFEKEGLVEGDDVEAVLSRTGHYLKDHNLDMATRELNQLKGWPKKLAEDWISAARRRLEVEQTINVAETEEMLAKITFV